MLEYINNPEVAIVYFLNYNFYPGRSCPEWGAQGLPEFPIIVENSQYNVANWFEGVANGSPRHIFLDRNFNYRYLTDDKTHIVDILEELINE